MPDTRPTRPSLPLTSSVAGSLAAGLLLLTGCEAQVSSPATQEPSEAHEDGAVWVFEDEALSEQLDTDAEGGLVTPVIEAPAEFNRIGARFDAWGPTEIQARGSKNGGETFGPWTQMNITWTEQPAHNAHVDLADGVTHVQLRFFAPIEARPEFLAVELFDFAPDEQDDGVGLGNNQAEQGLAGTGIAISRGEWGSRNVSCGSSHTPNRITVHHTYTPNNDTVSMATRIRGIQSYHIDNRGWCDIGYHFLIGQDGQVYQGRPEGKIGAHAGGANTNNAGVSYVGNFSSVQPSQGMMDAGARILGALSSQYGITLNRTKVKGHRQVGTTSTECPGNALYNRLEELIGLVDGVEPPPPPGFCATHNGTWCDGNDVVLCTGNNESSRTGCQFGCESMPMGTPDQCAAPPADQDPVGSEPIDDTPIDEPVDEPVEDPVQDDPVQDEPTAGSYNDVLSDHFAYDAAEKLRAVGAMWGCAAGYFCPDQALSKAELAYTIGVLDGMVFDAPPAPTFNDVSSSHWAYEGVEEVASRGWMEGCSNSTYCPGDSVSRAAAAVFVRRAKNFGGVAMDTPTFDDVPLTHWASVAVERLALEGIVSGCGGDNYCPSAYIKRSEIAVMLVHAYGL